MTPSEVIDVHDLPASEPVSQEVSPLWLEDQLPTLAELQRRYVLHVLDRTNGNKERAARILGINRRTLYRMQERWASQERG